MDNRAPETSLKPDRTPLVLGGMVVVGLLAALGGYLTWRSSQPVVTPAPVPVAPQPPVAPPPVDAGPTLTVEQAQTSFSRLASGWSTDPQFQQWLQGPAVRQVAAAVQLVADGQSPVAALPGFRLTGPYEVREVTVPAPKGRPRPPARVFVSPASYERYAVLVKAFDSLDTAAAGEAWQALRPVFDAAFGEIGKPGTRFDDVLKRALGRLTSVTFPEGEVELKAKGALYEYADPTLEALSPAEKQLLRLGPTQGRLVQARLKAFAKHAGLE